MINNIIAKYDPAISKAIELETIRQSHNIELIASENFTSSAVMAAQGSILTNKYAEGYPAKRYYSGCEYVDIVEDLAIERAKSLFGCSYANVQPHSGSQANQAVFLSLLTPGDTILSQSLAAGGHLTHGATPNLSGKWFKIINYGVKEADYLIDYEQIEELALIHKPKLIIAGFSAYSRNLDYARFRQIADKVGAYLLADIAHLAGLIATKQHQSPFPHAHIVTSTTHKTLRGPRGGLILADDIELGKKLNSAVFPGLQGGPLMHVIAAKAISFLEAAQPEFTLYIKQVIKNAQVLSNELIKRGYDILTGGTDNHMVLIDLRSKQLTGKEATDMLDQAGITCNKNNIPFDQASPFITSGLRIGTAACTTRGFKEAEFVKVAGMIADVLDKLQHDKASIELYLPQIKLQVQELCTNLPMYRNFM